MREGRKWLQLLVAGLLAGSLALAGCSGDDGSDGVNGESFALPEGETVGVLNCSTCHGSSTAAAGWSASAHAQQGDHTASSCAIACHNPLGDNAEAGAAFGVNSPMVVGCESCHGAGSGHFGVGAIPTAAPGTEVCATCHSGDQHASRHVFASEIATRFATSRHANQHARTQFCSACHSHEGGVALLGMGRKTSIVDLVDSYNSATVGAIYNITEEADLSVKKCSTCHDPHTAGLRGDGDVVASFTWDDDADPLTVDVTEETVVFSAEFNLCTACHMVDLVPTPAGHGDAGLLLSYELSDQYLKENLVDAATGTWKEVDIEGRGLTKAASVFYHDGTSANNRHFIDTHFAGQAFEALYYIGDENHVTNDIELTGYNINAANPNACTVCHDPHTGGKMLSPEQAENNDNAAIGYAEGVGAFHANHLGAAQGHGCTPCHSGDSFVPMTTRGVADTAPATSVIGCRTCHNLAVPNATPNTNDAAAFAAVREFQPGYEFKFPGGTSGVEDDVVVDVADLGVNQICFECHKGRTGVKPDAGTTTQVYGVSYLHYAPSMAILFGDESKMVPTYAGKTYSGKFVHGGGAVNGVTEFGCVDCHDVHNTNGNDVVQNKMVTSADCAGCHQSGAFVEADVLKARTVAFGQRLHDTILATYNTRFDPDITAEQLHTIIAGRNATSEIGANDLAYAASIYKIFNYEDGSPTGTEHGHGGSWAHNSRFARQVQYDAIEALTGDLTGLTRPN